MVIEMNSTARVKYLSSKHLFTNTLNIWLAIHKENRCVYMLKVLITCQLQTRVFGRWNPPGCCHGREGWGIVYIFVSAGQTTDKLKWEPFLSDVELQTCISVIWQVPFESDIFDVQVTLIRTLRPS